MQTIKDGLYEGSIMNYMGGALELYSSFMGIAIMLSVTRRQCHYTRVYQAMTHLSSESSFLHDMTRALTALQISLVRATPLDVLYCSICVRNALYARISEASHPGPLATQPSGCCRCIVGGHCGLPWT